MGGEEEELLGQMIYDREKRITLIQRKMDDQTRKMAQARQDILEISQQLEESSVQQELEKGQLIQRHARLVQQLLEQRDSLDMKKQQQGTALHMYTEVMKSVASPESRDSSYVMRMQAQLCKAMHSMGMVESQLALATKHSDQLSRFLKENFTKTVEEKSQVELKFMNELIMEDIDRKEWEDKNKELMDNFFNEKDALEKRIEDQAEASEEDDDEEREELMEILTQGREEMERMGEEIRKQRERIENQCEKLGREVPEIPNQEGDENGDDDEDGDE
jgi:ElaB/YqjD/DUF883 family membrane-anchored ribosome-binding protein